MQKKRAKWGLLFCLPFLIIFFIFQLYPLGYNFYLSLEMEAGPTNFSFVGLKNYSDLIHDKTFWISVCNTLKIWVMCFVPQLLISLILAVLFTQYRLKGAKAFRTIYYLPNLITAASIGALFSALFDWKTGSVNSFLLAIGAIKDNVNWMNYPSFAQGITAYIQWFMWFGSTSILLTSGIAAIPMDVIEAAIVDGANSWDRFWRITMPLLKPTILYVFVTSMIGGLQAFDIPMTLSKGSGEPQKSLMTMSLYLYTMGFRNNDLPYGATISYGIFVIVLVLSLVFYKVLYGGKEEEV